MIGSLLAVGHVHILTVMIIQVTVRKASINAPDVGSLIMVNQADLGIQIVSYIVQQV